MLSAAPDSGWASGFPSAAFSPQSVSHSFTALSPPPSSYTVLHSGVLQPESRGRALRRLSPASRRAPSRCVPSRAPALPPESCRRRLAPSAGFKPPARRSLGCRRAPFRKCCAVTLQHNPLTASRFPRAHALPPPAPPLDRRARRERRPQAPEPSEPHAPAARGRVARRGARAAGRHASQRLAVELAGRAPAG